MSVRVQFEAESTSMETETSVFHNELEDEGDRHVMKNQDSIDSSEVDMGLESLRAVKRKRRPRHVFPPPDGAEHLKLVRWRREGNGNSQSFTSYKHDDPHIHVDFFNDFEDIFDDDDLS